MGQESKNDYTLYLDDVAITPGQFPEITVPADAPEQEITPLLEPMEFTVTVQAKTPKRWRCRGRKRYIKLMRSEGSTRNYAERLADFTRTLMPYGEAWRNHLQHKRKAG